MRNDPIMRNKMDEGKAKAEQCIRGIKIKELPTFKKFKALHWFLSIYASPRDDLSVFQRYSKLYKYQLIIFLIFSTPLDSTRIFRTSPLSHCPPMAKSSTIFTHARVDAALLTIFIRFRVIQLGDLAVFARSVSYVSIIAAHCYGRNQSWGL